MACAKPATLEKAHATEETNLCAESTMPPSEPGQAVMPLAGEAFPDQLGWRLYDLERNE